MEKFKCFQPKENDEAKMLAEKLTEMQAAFEKKIADDAAVKCQNTENLLPKPTLAKAQPSLGLADHDTLIYILQLTFSNVFLVIQYSS